MLTFGLILLCVTAQQDLSDYPLAQIRDTAMEYLQEGELELAMSAFSEIMARMPHLGRVRYNLAGVLFELEMYPDADTLISTGDLGTGADSVVSASAASLLGTSIAAGDYTGVEAAYNQLREIITEGSSHDCDRTNFEVAINWLRNNEPPEDQSQDQQDQSEDQQDQSEDQQDQSEDQQDQSEDQQDQSEDQQDQSEDQQEEQSSPPPPTQGDMTEEDAERILDLVEEAEPADRTEGSKGFTISGPVW
jgi:hypothetical protein